MRYCLISIRAWSHFLSHPACLAPFRVVKNGFNWSVKREMNRPRATNRPVSCRTHFLVVEG